MEINSDGTIFTFKQGFQATKFDKWSHYTALANSLDLKGCDLVAHNGKELWFIEVKDYSYRDAVFPNDLHKTVGLKCIGAMAVLFSLARCANDSNEVGFARSVHGVEKIRLGLHVVIPDEKRRARKKQAVLPAFKHKIRRIARQLGAKEFISLNLNSPSEFPWETRRDSETRKKHLSP